MIIENIPYIHLNNDLSCSASACLSMLLSYYGIEANAVDLSNELDVIFMQRLSRGLRDDGLAIYDDGTPEMFDCIEYYLKKRYPNVSGESTYTDVASIPLSYIKRKIPVMLQGNFPFIGGTITTTVLVKGYVGPYLVVNDPRGNALTRYTVAYGENILYPIERLREWASPSKKSCIFRIVSVQ